MRFLFVHQNFPGQFRHILHALAGDRQHVIVGIGDAAHVKPDTLSHPRITVRTYPSPIGGGQHTHPYLRETEAHVRRGQQVFRLASSLKTEGFSPDIIVVHPGWGEGLFLKELFPDAKHIHYCEFFYRPDGADVGFDPEFPTSLNARLTVQVRNSAQLLGLASCDAGVSPTPWQKGRYPAEFQAKIRVLHEGIDCDVLRPDPHAALALQGKLFRAGEEIVTYVARNLEPYRGFHSFMRSLPALQQLRPHAQVLIVGGDQVSYGSRLPPGKSYRDKYSAEVADRLDWSRVHFLGKLPYADYRKVLQVSAAHVYLTYPFVLSWSMLEAMACGCLVIGSATAPVQDVITEGENGLLTDFFDSAALAAKVAQALSCPQACLSLRERARAYIVAHYDVKTRCIPDWLDFLRER